MKKSDLDRLNPKADSMTGFDFYNRGNIGKDSYSMTTNKYGILFFSSFIVSCVGFLFLLLNSSYYLKNYGDSLSALAITLLIIISISFIIASIINLIYLKLKK
ncbi:hypothetical protein [Vagococcus fluvialis]|uniref:hypothetical protein n=1 Tax=Vagococcus fluvialis TaxID=2738 RepID=UPI003B5B135C